MAEKRIAFAGLGRRFRGAKPVAAHRKRYKCDRIAVTEIRTASEEVLKNRVTMSLGLITKLKYWYSIFQHFAATRVNVKAEASSYAIVMPASFSCKVEEERDRFPIISVEELTTSFSNGLPHASIPKGFKPPQIQYKCAYTMQDWIVPAV